MSSPTEIELSVIIVSYNTREVLQRCLESLSNELKGFKAEVILIDNDSKDGSKEMVETLFPKIRLIASKVNLGFAGANNLGFKLARGKYCVLLNSDAFLHTGALRKAFEHMEKNPKLGLAGGRLVGEDNSWQPSARKFPTILHDLLHMSGLAAKYPKSKFFGAADRTWADPKDSTLTDWVPGAFAIISKEALEHVGYFDERFFLYYEEIDLCKRLKKAGYEIGYFGDVVITHIGGESSKTNKSLLYSKSGSQLELWRMRSQMLYYRKHKGLLGAYISKSTETFWHKIRAWKNKYEGNLEKAEESKAIIKLLEQAWQDTSGGKDSPSKPW